MAIPKGTEIPESESSFLQFVANQKVKLRILTDFNVGYKYFQADNSVVLSKEEPKELINPGKKYKSDNLITKATQIWVAHVFNYNTGNIETWEINQSSIKKSLQALEKEDVWGDSKDYDLTVFADDSSSVRKYVVNPLPHKEVGKEILEKFKNFQYKIEEFFIPKED